VTKCAAAVRLVARSGDRPQRTGCVVRGDNRPDTSPIRGRRPCRPAREAVSPWPLPDGWRL